MKKKINSTTILVLSTVIFELIVNSINGLEDSFQYYIPLFIIYALSSFFFLSKEKDWKKNIFYLIYFVAVLIRTLYILKTDIYIRQYDVNSLSDEGHLRYIYILYETNRLPLTNTWQFYHPPLWHSLAAIWLKINDLFHSNISWALENIQILCLVFSSSIVLIVDRICQKLKLKYRYRYLTDIVFAVHPSLILLSGCINNDCLLTFLEFLICLLLINWYQETTWKNTIYLAIATGLCVMTKANGAIMAVPILCVFGRKISSIKKKKEFSLMFKKILTFGCISLPIGLWFQVRSLIKFNNISVPRPADWLLVGDIPFVKKFFLINFHELFNFANMGTDYSIISFIIKSSLFGEFHYNISGFLRISIISVNFVLIIISLMFLIKYLFDKKKNINMSILLVTWLISIVAMYVFYYKYPYTCTMDFRYMVICLLFGILIISYYLNIMKNKYLKCIIEILIYLFVLLSIILVYRM